MLEEMSSWRRRVVEEAILEEVVLEVACGLLE